MAEQESTTVDTADVAIIGAGVAGLVAGRELDRQGLDVVVIEARDRVGGRTYTQPLGEDSWVDVGGQWVGPGQDRIITLAAELGIDLFPSHTEGEPRFLINDTATSYERPAIANTLGLLDAMVAELPVDAPWTHPRAAEWDAQTVATWLAAEIVDEPVARAFVDVFISGIFTADPAELSMLHALVYIRSAGSIGHLSSAQDQRFVGGAQQVALRIAERLGPRVRLGTPVRRITEGDDVVDIDADGLAIRARRVVVAVPIGVADRIAYSPPLPAARAQLHQRFAPGSAIKINVVYATPFWREQGLNGRMLANDAPFSVTFDNSPPTGSPGIMVDFSEADDSRRLRRLAPLERRRTVVDFLVRPYGHEAAEPIDYVEMDWSEEEWTRGCYGANVAPGVWTRYGEAVREPVGLIDWAGAETSAIWMNYIDGAVRSGERAAAEVAAALAATV